MVLPDIINPLHLQIMKLIDWAQQNPWLAASFILAMANYFPLCKGLLSTDPEKRITQNIATWVLWILLDIVVLIPILLNHGNAAVLFAYVTGGVITCFCILKSCTFTWTRVETVTTALVAVCLAVWAVYGSEATIIASTIAGVLASIPQIVNSWKNPVSNPFLVYAAFTTTNTLSFIGGKDWSIEERYCSGVSALTNLVITLCISRKFSKELVALHRT